MAENNQSEKGKPIKNSEKPLEKTLEKLDLECTGDVCKVKRPVDDYRKTGKYAVLMETNGQENESWYYFIKYEGNEEALNHLKSQIDQVDFYMLDDFSVFDIDLDNLVSAQTAKEMSKLEINSVMFHKKFDGKLQKINIRLKRGDENDDMIEKFYDKLGNGNIENYVSDEDIDPEDIVSELSEGSESVETEDSSEEVEYPKSPVRNKKRNDNDRNRDFKNEKDLKEKESTVPVRTEKGVRFPEKLPSDMPKFALRRKRG